MAERKNDPEAVLNRMIKRNIYSQFAEYGCGLVATGGAIALGIMQNASVFAAGPLALSVWLNIFNRRWMDQLTRQHTFADVTEIKRSLAAELQALRTEFEALPASETGAEDLQLSLTALADRVESLDQQVQQPAELPGEALGVMEQDIAQLKHHHIEMAQSLEDIRQQGSGTENEAMPEVLEEIAGLKDAIATVETQVANPDKVTPDLEPVRAEFQAMLSPVQSQVSLLSDKLGMGDFDPNYQPVNANEIQGQFDGLNTKIESMFVNVSDEMNAFRGNLENTQGQLQALQAQVGEVQSQEVPSPEALDVQVQAALTPIKDHLSGLESRVNEMSTASAGQSAEQLEAVQNQITEVDNRLNQVSANVSAELSNLPELVANQVRSQVDSIPTPPPAAAPAAPKPKKTDLKELDDLLADLEN